MGGPRAAWGWHLPTRREVRQNSQLLVLRGELRIERRREQLPEQLLERLLELLATQLDEQLATHVQIQAATQVQTHVLTQASTRLRLLLQVLPDGLLWVLRREHQRGVRVLDSTARAATLRQMNDGRAAPTRTAGRRNTCGAL